MNGRRVLDKLRARRDASKVLAVALQTRYRRFLETADDQDANAMATADLAQCMYENIEFILWSLKTLGGMSPAPPHELSKITPARPAPTPANDPRSVKPPEPVLETVLDLPCTCPPLEPGIIGRERHMTSCPKFVP
jgi:hypothetical protein